MTKRTIKITTLADVPEDLAQKWLQHLRDFDTAHPGCHFQVLAENPDMAMELVRKMLEIDPPLAHQIFFADPSRRK